MRLFTREFWEHEQWEWELGTEGMTAFPDGDSQEGENSDGGELEGTELPMPTTDAADERMKMEEDDEEDHFDRVTSANNLPEPPHVVATYRAFFPGQAVVINSTYPDSHRMPYSAKVLGLDSDGSGVCFEIDADAIEGHGWEGWAGNFALTWEHIPLCVYSGTAEERRLGRQGP